MINVSMSRFDSGELVARHQKQHTPKSALGILVEEIALGGMMIAQGSLQLAVETRTGHVVDSTNFVGSTAGDLNLFWIYLQQFREQVAGVLDARARSIRRAALNALCLTLEKPVVEDWGCRCPLLLDAGDLIAAFELVDEGAATLAEALALA